MALRPGFTAGSSPPGAQIFVSINSLYIVSPDNYEGESTATHVAPLPIGRTGRHILELANAEVAPRAVDYYAALVEGRRAS